MAAVTQPGHGPAPSRAPAPHDRVGRWLRRAAIGVVVLLALAGGSYALASRLTEQSFWARVVAWGESDFHDDEKFPARAIPNGPRVLALRSAPPELPAELQTVRFSDATGAAASAPLDAFLASTGSTAFLVLHDDQLLVERYASGSSHEATQTSFSTAKSFVSTLVGIAVGEGLVGGVDDPLVRYLPELRGRGLDDVTIGHLMNMASGIAYDGGGSGGMPWQDDAKTYYDPDLRRLALTVRPAGRPNARWQYNNYHPLLLGLVLERATGRSVSAYMAEKLWGPMGAEAPASWSLDSEHDGFEKMESGINARAADFARFGRLFLRGGEQNGRQVVPRAWVQAATHPIAGSPVQHYGYFWWLDAARPGRFYAAGNFGQFVYVAPDRDAVVVRFGERFGGLSLDGWTATLRAVADAVPSSSGGR
jgi:CubicO group peptidase (beta-lactamase class C family)